jgi:hypothetical protein
VEVMMATACRAPATAACACSVAVIALLLPIAENDFLFCCRLLRKQCKGAIQ